MIYRVSSDPALSRAFRRIKRETADEIKRDLFETVCLCCADSCSRLPEQTRRRLCVRKVSRENSRGARKTDGNSRGDRALVVRVGKIINSRLMMWDFIYKCNSFYLKILLRKLSYKKAFNFMKCLLNFFIVNPMKNTNLYKNWAEIYSTIKTDTFPYWLNWIF